MEFATSWAASKSGVEPDERSIAVLWNLLEAFPPDDNCVRYVPAEVHNLAWEWRDALEGRPGWAFKEEREEG